MPDFVGGRDSHQAVAVGHLGKWHTLWLLALVELLAMTVWFSASAVVPALSQRWLLTDPGRAWLTMSVQVGFVVGAFGSALFNIADRVPARLLITLSTLAAATVTALIPAVVTSLGPALALRFLTGVFLAGVYPVGMKIMATWTRRDSADKSWVPPHSLHNPYGAIAGALGGLGMGLCLSRSWTRCRHLGYGCIETIPCRNSPSRRQKIDGRF